MEPPETSPSHVLHHSRPTGVPVGAPPAHGCKGAPPRRSMAVLRLGLNTGTDAASSTRTAMALHTGCSPRSPPHRLMQAHPSEAQQVQRDAHGPEEVGCKDQARGGAARLHVAEAEPSRCCEAQVDRLGVRRPALEPLQQRGSTEHGGSGGRKEGGGIEHTATKEGAAGAARTSCGDNNRLYPPPPAFAAPVGDLDEEEDTEAERQRIQESGKDATGTRLRDDDEADRRDDRDGEVDRVDPAEALEDVVGYCSKEDEGDNAKGAQRHPRTRQELFACDVQEICSSTGGLLWPRRGGSEGRSNIAASVFATRDIYNWLRSHFLLAQEAA